MDKVNTLPFQTIEEKDIDLFFKPARLIVSGTSGSGKSSFCEALIKKYHASFSIIYIIGSNLGADIENVKRHESFNDLYISSNEKKLIMLDDQLFCKRSMILAADIFIRSRHLNTSIILISQSVYYNYHNYRICMLNASHILLFKSRSVKTIKLFARSFLDEKNRGFC